MSNKNLSFWVIMDKNKKAIACGSPKNRSMRLVESLDTNKVRILLYGTEKRARAAFSKGLGFYDETYNSHEFPPSKTYLRQTYGNPEILLRFDEICVPVKVALVIADE